MLKEIIVPAAFVLGLAVTPNVTGEGWGGLTTEVQAKTPAEKQAKQEKKLDRAEVKLGKNLGKLARKEVKNPDGAHKDVLSDIDHLMDKIADLMAKLGL